MSIGRLLRLIIRTGRVAEPVTDGVDHGLQIRDGFTPPRELRGSAQVRHVDAGSCNGCEIEIGAAFGPVYDAERFGARLVASPRHADVVTVAKRTKNGLRDIDARPSVVSASASAVERTS